MTIKSLVSNWRTSLAGVGVVFGALADMAHQASSGQADPGRLWADVTAIVGAIGLFAAKDA